MSNVPLYGQIYSESAVEFIEKIDEIEQEGEPLVVRVNCVGGVPEYGWGMAARFKEFKGEKTVKVDGQAHSMALMFLCYVDDSEAIDTSEFLLHRAAYPDYIENSPEWFTEDMKGNLMRVNKSLKSALEAKIDVEKFNNLKQVKEKDITFNDIFSMDSREEIFLTATDAKKIGLINRIVQLTPSKKAEITAFQKAAQYFPKESKKTVTIEVETKIKKTMDIETLKAEHPSVYKQAVEIGQIQERERVESFMVFADTDIKAVKEGIESGKALSPKQMSEFVLKAASKEKVADVKDDAAKDTKTGEPVVAATEKEQKLSAFEKEARAAVGLKN